MTCTVEISGSYLFHTNRIIIQQENTDTLILNMPTENDMKVFCSKAMANISNRRTHLEMPIKTLEQ